MKYLHVTERSGRYVSELREAAVPEPRADEVLVRVAASGLNRADLSQIAGRYPPPPGEPAILGLEVAGTLPGSDERVCALLAGGGHAEYVAAPRGQVFPAPPAPAGTPRRASRAAPRGRTPAGCPGGTARPAPLSRCGCDPAAWSR